MEKRINNGRDLICDIDIGTKLSIKIEDIAIPITSSFVGMEKGEYFILKQPSPFSTIKPKLFPGNQLIVKYLSNGMIYVFASNIIETLSKPIRVVILEYPARVIERKLRSEDRAGCSLAAGIVFKGTPKNVVIRDINMTGCRIAVTYKPSEKNHIARKSDALKISIRLPGTSRDIMIAGIVRNVQKKGLSVSYGVQFDNVPVDVRDSIKNYIATIQI
ncbi:flagellar brake domain-containing protein [Desulfobacula phenolica]|uniref:PilZ domain-containing protein n=1 Tax=Desulfobacula phenolica TaxID=90732 RepID=A0A1H2FKQ1_9BACT|nr:flagellar brake protein [Desulfobacula phenolica]SDU07926.1 PilZ domain-containing protein [Desulfobacula phenolica]